MRPVNLLPAKHRARTGGGEGSKASYIALGVLGALVLAVLFYVMTANQLSSRNAELAKVRQQAQAAESQAVTLSSFGAFAGTKAARVEAVRSLATARLDWERVFRELAHVLPANVWLTSFDGKIASGDTGTGTEGPGGPALDLKGCAASYSSVADVMVRLRELHGVQEVVLSESTKAEGGGGAAGATAAGSSAGTAGASCGSYNSFSVAVQLAPADGVAVPGQAASVPARLGGGG
jgi:Tfp pilus assembly protein PilN